MLPRLAFAACSALLLSACGQSLSDLPGFDATAWRRDQRGCAGVRQTQLPALERNREKLYGARVAVVEGLLGRPDENELQEQSQRVYSYYLAPGPQCRPGTSDPTRRLLIRFGSLGTVTEMLYSSAPAPKTPAR